MTNREDVEVEAPTPDQIERGDELTALVEQYNEIGGEVKELNGVRKALKTDIDEIMEESGEERVGSDTFLVFTVRRTNKKISAEKLLSKGVDVGTIEECTEVKESTNYQVKAR